MWVNLDSVAVELQKHFSVQLYGNAYRDITKIERLPVSASVSLSQDILYITTPVGLEKMGTIACLAPILCVADLYLLIDQSLFPGKTIIVVRSKDISEVLLKLADIMYELGMHSSKLSEFTKCLLCGSDVQQMLDIGFSFLGNPIIVVDSHQNIIGYTKLESIKDTIDSMENSLTPITKPEQIQQDFNESFVFSGSTVNVNQEDGISVLRKVLISGGRIEGYLKVMASLKPFSDYDIEAVEILSNFITIELLRIHITNTRTTNLGKVEAFLKNLMDSNLVNRKIIEENSELLKLNFKKFLYVVTIQSQRARDKNTVAMHEMIAILTYALPGSKGFFYENSIILLYSANQRIADLQVTFASLISIMKTNKLQGGISNAFYSIVDIRAHYFQSRKAVELGPHFDPSKQLYCYEEYSIYHMMELSSTFGSLMCFCHSSIFNLLEHDAHMDGEFVITLHTYLKNGSNKIKTAKALHVHLNTIKYRLAQISEILGVDLDDGEIAFSLNHTLKTLHFLKIFPPSS